MKTVEAQAVEIAVRILQANGFAVSAVLNAADAEDRHAELFEALFG